MGSRETTGTGTYESGLKAKALKMSCDGLGTKEIARTLDVNPWTVKVWLRNARRKAEIEDGGGEREDQQVPSALSSNYPGVRVTPRGHSGAIEVNQYGQVLHQRAPEGF